MSRHRLLLIVGGIVAVFVVVGGIVLAQPFAAAGAKDKPAQQAPGIPEAAVPARADLAKRLGVPADKIAVDAVKEETWNDASLGLPEPGMMYAQVVTSGHVVTLSYDGKSYTYHVAGEAARLKP